VERTAQLASPVEPGMSAHMMGVSVTMLTSLLVTAVMKEDSRKKKTNNRRPLPLALQE
jgi:hypothetical protein